MLKTLIRLFSLKPFDDDLADGMAQIWLLLARVNIAAVAFCDSAAWAHLGFTTATGTTAYGIAVIAGVIALALVGGLDASFIMHDTSYRKSDESGHVPTALVAARVGKWLRRMLRRDHLGVAVRISLVILSFTVTAPFLSQMFFSRDITAEIARRNERSVAMKAQEITRNFDSQLESLRASFAARQHDLEVEIAGAGRSGRYGEGPTAKAIDNEIAQLNAEIGKTQSAKAAALVAFQNASKYPEQMAKLYGVDVIREGPDTRARVVADLEKSPAFRSVHRTITAFLLFLFLCLVSLKLFQPESVKIYFNARLQAAYARLKVGIFDKHLDEKERADTGAMPPLHFAHWYANQQRVRELSEEAQQRMALVIEQMNIEDNALRVLREGLATRVTKMSEDHAAASLASDNLAEQLTSRENERKVLQGKIVAQQQELDDFRHDRHEDLSLSDKQFLVAGRDKTARQLTANRVLENNLAATIDKLRLQLERNREYVSRIAASIDTAGAEATALEELVAKARRRKLDEIFPAD